MTLVGYLSIQAHANRLANLRLHEAMKVLDRSAFHAPRVGFFPSLAATLNHLLAVDLYYLGALHGEPEGAAVFHRFVPADTVAELQQRQAASDARLVAFCDRLDEAGCDAEVVMDRGDRVQRDRTGHVLAHLFMHQTHHRGQAHAMLSGTAVAPPQLDEFLLPSEAHLRVPEMRAMGWREEAVYAPAPWAGSSPKHAP
ncbi:DinB family protein [Aquincola sp. MAHUQ-54]|uniref:DinB family protein n=1 Tax=Aquincola agrisoli TaxID=3119538 RepID=A0AAW9QDS2_9BURK